MELFGGVVKAMKSSNSRNKSGTPVFLALGGVSWIVAAGLLAHAWPLERQRHEPTAHKSHSVLQKDPQIGSRFKWFDSTKLLPVRSNERSLVLIALGACDSCAVQSFDETALSGANSATFAKVLSHEQQEVEINEIPKVDSRLSYEIRLPRDYYDGLNAQWAPRFYTVDSDGTLKSIQKLRESPIQFFSRSGS